MRATKTDQAIAERVGRSASTVVRHRTGGMWPLDPMAKIERHYDVMDACGMGEGRDNWIVALDAAVRFEWPVVMLRPILSDPPAIDAERFASRVRVLIVTLAKCIEGLRGYGSTTDMAEAVTDDVFSAVEQAVQGDETTSADFDDTAELVDTTIDRITDAGTLSDDSGDETAAARFSDDVRAEILGLVERFSTWRPWVQDAPAKGLIRAVVLADGVVALLDKLPFRDIPGGTLRSDERWREVAWLAPWCGAELIPAGFDQHLPVLGQIVAPEPPPSLDGQTEQPENEEPNP